MITLYQMDVLKALKQIPDEFVDMQICSPPYWGLRDYGEGVEVIWDGDENCEHDFENYEFKQYAGRGDAQKSGKYSEQEPIPDKILGAGFCTKCGAWKGQLGLEPDFNLYVKHMIQIFNEVKRVLKKDGTCWVNLGDTYSSTPMASISDKADISQGTLKSQLNRLDTSKCGIQPKCLCAIPERFMIEMINRGWILRNKIIWHKPNHMPTSVKDRFVTSWEYLFMFSKSKKYYFDLDAVREPHKVGTPQAERDYNRMMAGRQEFEGIRKNSGVQNAFVAGNPKGKNPDDIIQTRSAAYRHHGSGSGERSGFKLSEAAQQLGKNSDDIIQVPNHPKGDENRGMRLPPQANQPNAFHPLGKNPSDFWDITTRGYPEAHFAVFPEALVKRPIKTTPMWICKKCGKARERIVETELIVTKEYEDKGKARIIDTDKKIPAIPRARTGKEGYNEYHTKGWTDCKCGAGWKPAVIMDIFVGSGTTLKVARDLHRDSIGIEIKKEYCDLTFKRLYKGNIPLDKNEFKLKNE